MGHWQPWPRPSYAGLSTLGEARDAFEIALLGAWRLARRKERNEEATVPFSTAAPPELSLCDKIPVGPYAPGGGG